MAEVESSKYTNENRNKHKAAHGRFNQPTQFHPDRLASHTNKKTKKSKLK